MNDDPNEDAPPPDNIKGLANVVWADAYKENGMLYSKGVATSMTLPDGTVVDLPGPFEVEFFEGTNDRANSVNVHSEQQDGKV